MNAALPARIRANDRLRRMVTPEGIVLPLTLASRGARFGALVLDPFSGGTAQSERPPVILSRTCREQSMIRSHSGERLPRERRQVSRFAVIA